MKKTDLKEKGKKEKDKDKKKKEKAEKEERRAALRSTLGGWDAEPSPEQKLLQSRQEGALAAAELIQSDTLGLDHLKGLPTAAIHAAMHGYKLPICTEYLGGYCSQGHLCEWRHPESFDEMIKWKKFFLRVPCEFGVTCPNQARCVHLHEAPAGNPDKRRYKMPEYSDMPTGPPPVRIRVDTEG